MYRPHVPLFVLPFDHRAAFAREMLGIPLDGVTPEIAARVTDLKLAVWEAVARVIADGVPRESVAVLVDDKFGMPVMDAAKAAGVALATCVEKSGQEEFQFEHGDAWKEELEKLNPEIVKVLVRWHPARSQDKEAQLARLRAVSDYCRESGRGMMFELLLVAASEEDRPALVVECAQEFYAAGIRPALWKIEGLESEGDFGAVMRAIHENDADAKAIVLGRNETAERVRHWLAVGKATPGVIGFAIGRTLFLDPLKQLAAGAISREEAVSRVAAEFKDSIDFWMA